MPISASIWQPQSACQPPYQCLAGALGSRGEGRQTTTIVGMPAQLLRHAHILLLALSQGLVAVDGGQVPRVLPEAGGAAGARGAVVSGSSATAGAAALACCQKHNVLALDKVAKHTFCCCVDRVCK